MIGLGDTVKNYLIAGLTVWALTASVGVWGYRHKAIAATATTAPLKAAATDANKYAEGYRAAQQACVNEMARVRTANEQAVRDAQQAKADADAAREAFERKLEDPTGCEDILEAKVCPRLLGY